MGDTSVEKKTIRVLHVPIIRTPREAAVMRVKRKMARDGWQCVDDHPRDGIFGFGAHIELKFERQKELQ